MGYQERLWDVELIPWDQPESQPHVDYNNFEGLGLCICASDSQLGRDIETGRVRTQPFYHDLESISAGYEYQGGLFGILQQPWNHHQPGTLVMELWIEPPRNPGARKAFCFERKKNA